MRELDRDKTIEQLNEIMEFELEREREEIDKDVKIDFKSSQKLLFHEAEY